MSKPVANILACPLDDLPLSVHTRQVMCPNGHNFDIARQGYINLLPVQHKHSKQPGDNEDMVRARTEFLNSGAYAPIANTLTTITCELCAARQGSGFALLDAGCGEGYYLTQLVSSLHQQPVQKEVTLVGLDISKPAIIAAAKRSKQITWLIASNKHLPLLPRSIDSILCLFGYPMYVSFNRVLKPGGTIIQVEAGTKHLLELRRVIYPNVNLSPPPDLTAAEAEGFVLQHELHLDYRHMLTSNAQIMNLLLMTPHFFRASQTGKHAAMQLDSIELTVDVIFRVLKRAAG